MKREIKNLKRIRKTANECKKEKTEGWKNIKVKRSSPTDPYILEDQSSKKMIKRGLKDGTIVRSKDGKLRFTKEADRRFGL